MLASLLRRLIFIQAAAGAILGFLLHRLAGTTPWSSLVGALLVPILSTLLVCLVTGLKSKTRGEPLGPWLRAVWGEFWASLLIFLLRQPWTVEAPYAQPATGGSGPQVPVLLVHGYVCNHRVWDTLARGLRAQGHTVMAVNLEPLFTSIDKYVMPIEVAVMELCQQTGASQVALVGHSMGGLAIRTWMRTCGVDRVARVLTLGTPHAGTQLAPNTRTPNGIQMGWQSTWLAELAASESDALRSRIRIAITPQDGIVYPQRAQVLPGVETTVFDGLGHLQMCLDISVREWVYAQLRGLLPDTRGATT
ncbi:MAG: alpha/beta fold hydrolase [Pseudomonadota bacterium]